MKINFLIEYIVYSILKVLAMVFRFLPYGLSVSIGRKIGALGSYLNLKRKAIAYANLKSALGHKYMPWQLKKILAKSYENIGQGLMDVFIIPRLNRAYADKNFIYEGFEKIDNALKKGKGVILLTGHFGNWEIINAALPLKGYVYKTIAREQKPFLINRLLNKYRQWHGCKMVSKGMPIREIIKALKSNEIVGMLVDQDAGKGGVFVDLFNRPASWNRGVMEFALKTGCTIIPGFNARQSGAKFKFSVCDPIVFPESGSKEEKIKEGFRQFAALLEAAIAKYPDQWLWQHKRWKSTPRRKILILNDTRTGHLHQSKAVALQLKKTYESKGIPSEEILTEIIDIKFKNPTARSILYFCCHFSNLISQGNTACLKSSLNEQPYRRIMKVCADVIISCGTKTAAVNLFLAKECNARSVIVMNPGNFLLSKFDLAILPRHDRPIKAKNTVITDGAPNLMDKALVQYQAESLKYEISPAKNFKIGLLLGGDYKNFYMRKEIILGVIEQLKAAAKTFNADILATTSRRTPEEIEALLKTGLSKDPNCRLLVIANQQNKEGVVGGILGLCDITLVSPESISMISEAASSGTYVIVFGADDISNKRHQAFLKNLQDRGYIKTVKTEDISKSINVYLQEKPDRKILDDNLQIRKGLEKII